MHPLDIFKFCPKCSSSHFLESTPIAKKCADCGFEHFKNPVMGAAVVIFDDQDRLLCIRRAKNPGKGTLGVPGGFVDIKETIEQAAIRETKEETGIEIEVSGLIANIPNTYIYNGEERYPLDFYFSGKIKNMSGMHAQEGEVDDVLFIPRDEINPDEFGMASSRILLKKILNK